MPLETNLRIKTNSFSDGNCTYTFVENKVSSTDKKAITIWLSVENAIDNVPEKTIFRIWRHKPRCRGDLGLGYADITNSGEYINQPNIKEVLSSLPLGLYELKMIHNPEEPIIESKTESRLCSSSFCKRVVDCE